MGLTMGLYCSAMGINYDLYEKRPQNTTSKLAPAAHYLSTRSMEVFSELYKLEDDIHSRAEDINRFGVYRYCRRVGELDYFIEK